MKQLDSINILERLIGFESISRHSNLDLIDFVRNYLNDYAIHSELAFNRQHDRANLYATIGPDDTGGVMLSGHTDVVPVDGQDWSSNPFKLKYTDENVIGRGSCDMKGFIACVLAGVPQMVESPLKTPIHLAFSYDEEIGCVGVRDLVEKLKQYDVLPKLGVIGEPTSMCTVLGHKGKCSFEVNFKGHSCHSAFVDDGINAIEYAAELITFIKQMNRRLKDKGCTDSGYKVDHSTFHTGVIQGGTALNIVPNHCQFIFEIRNLPQDDIEQLVNTIQNFAQNQILPRMRQLNNQCDIEFKPLSSYPGLHTDHQSDCVKFVNGVHPASSHIEKISFGTEAGIFSEQLDVDCVVCGPGSIVQAHKPDEYVSVEQLNACDQFISNLIYKCQETTL